MKPTIHLKPGETASAAILRLHKHIRRMNPSYQPTPGYAAGAKNKLAAARPANLRLVK